MRKVLILCFGLVFGSVALKAQTGLPPREPHPQIGEVIPDLTFSNVKYYKSEKLSFSDFRGKWLFIDFWFPGCHNCILTLKPFSDLQRKFQKDIQFVLVGANDKQYGGTEALFDKLRKKQDLQLISVYDSMRYMKWGIWAMPEILVVDPQGILRYVTSGQDLSAEKVQDLIDGKPISIYEVDVSEEPSDPEETVVVRNKEIAYESTIRRWNGEPSLATEINWFDQIPVKYKQKGFRIHSSTLQQLYIDAYVGQNSWGLWDRLYAQTFDSTFYRRKYLYLYGKLYPEVIVEVSDQKPFEFDKDHPRNGGLYNYDLTSERIGSMSRNELMQTMKQDLKNCFGYEVTMEERTMPYFKLVGDKRRLEKMKSVHDKFWITPGSTAAGFEARHVSMERFLLSAAEYIRDGMPLLMDETGADFTIDVKIDADMTNKEQVMRELHKLGLDIVKAEKVMQVIVIRDAPVAP